MTANYHAWIAQHPELANVLPPSNRKSAPAPKAKRATVRAPLPPPSREGDTVTLCLPLPDSRLHANGRAHHMARARLVKEAREMAGLLARIVAPPQPWQRARIDAESWSARKQDPLNFWHGMKAYVDGCGDGGLFINDRDVEEGSVVQHTGKLSEGKRMVILKITRIS